jgi:hypothetical protein
MFSRIRFTLAGAATATGLILHGCAVGPDYQPPAIESPSAFREDANWKRASPDEHWIPQKPLTGHRSLHLGEKVVPAGLFILSSKRQRRRAGLFHRVADPLCSLKNGMTSYSEVP